MMTTRPPLPPFTEQTARRKVQAAEDAWNTRDPRQVALAYTEDSAWRNRGTFVTGHGQIVGLPDPEVGTRARLHAPQGTVGLRQQRPDEPPRGQHQRRPDPGEKPAASSTSCSSSCSAPGSTRPRRTTAPPPGLARSPTPSPGPPSPSCTPSPATIGPSAPWLPPSASPAQSSPAAFLLRSAAPRPPT
jgi:hypothetical protein